MHLNWTSKRFKKLKKQLEINRNLNRFLLPSKSMQFNLLITRKKKKKVLQGQNQQKKNKNNLRHHLFKTELDNQWFLSRILIKLIVVATQGRNMCQILRWQWLHRIKQGWKKPGIKLLCRRKYLEWLILKLLLLNKLK